MCCFGQCSTPSPPPIRFGKLLSMDTHFGTNKAFQCKQADTPVIQQTLTPQLEVRDVGLEAQGMPVAVASKRIEAPTWFLRDHHIAAALLVRVALDMVLLVDNITVDHDNVVSDISSNYFRNLEQPVGTSSSIPFFLQSLCASARSRLELSTSFRYPEYLTQTL